MPALPINRILILEIQMKFLIKSPLKNNQFDLRHSNTTEEKSKLPFKIQGHLMR